MAFYYAYSRPPYETTFVDQTFPEHHFPFEHTRHRLGHAINEIFNPYAGEHIVTPYADIRETAKKFYIDIELPGLSSKDNIGLKWINTMTLLVDATIKRPDINETKEAPSDQEASTDENPVHTLNHERKVGRFVRSFYFCVEVEQEKMEAKLTCGLLRIVVEKKPHEQKEAKTVEIDHLDS